MSEVWNDIHRLKERLKELQEGTTTNAGAAYWAEVRRNEYFEPTAKQTSDASRSEANLNPV